MYVFTQIKIITLTKVQKHFYEESWLARIILCLDGFLCQLNFDTYTKKQALPTENTELSLQRQSSCIHVFPHTALKCIHKLKLNV